MIYIYILKHKCNHLMGVRGGKCAKDKKCIYGAMILK